MKHRGIFISLEGMDGAGKSTQFRLLVKHLRARGYQVCATREPGGTQLGEQIRGILLDSRNKELRPLTELTLMYAARAQHLEEVVRPALDQGKIVISDRFNDASLAYQGYGRQLGVAAVSALDRIICGRTQPDLTLVLDLAPRLALKRALLRKNPSRQERFEAQGLKFHERVRAGYLTIARQAPRRVKVVRADRPMAAVQAEIRNLVDAFLAQRQWSGARGWGLGRKAERKSKIKNKDDR